MWFQYLKLALELESLGVNEIVTKQGFWDRSAPSGGQGVGMKFRTKDTLKFKIMKQIYKGWDLDRVLTESFDDWWYGHEGWGFRWKKVGNKLNMFFVSGK